MKNTHQNELSWVWGTFGFIISLGIMVLIKSKNLTLQLLFGNVNVVFLHVSVFLGVIYVPGQMILLGVLSTTL